MLMVIVAGAGSGVTVVATGFGAVTVNGQRAGAHSSSCKDDSCITGVLSAALPVREIVYGAVSL